MTPKHSPRISLKSCNLELFCHGRRQAKQDDGLSHERAM